VQKKVVGKGVGKKRSAGLNKARNVLKNTINVSVIVDTREKNPWDLKGKMPSGFKIKNIYTDKLDAGDYSIVGHDLPNDDFSIVIERKASLEEFIGNIGRGWKRFQIELEKMAQYKNPVIIIEDDLKDSYSKYKMKKGPGRYFNVSPDFILKRVSEIYTKYGVPTVFASNKYFAQRLAGQLFRDVLKLDSLLDG
jgi:ERCC4-type nuclease